MSLIQLQRVLVGYHLRPVLPLLDLEIPRGVFLGIVGPNGSGKTTLARTILGLLPPLSGTIAFPEGKPRFGYVPQREAVNRSFPLTVIEIVRMGRYGRHAIAARAGAADEAAARRALGDVGAAALSESPFHTLSGGQRQRVLIARALAGEPDALVLDEPTTGMDLPSEDALLRLVASFRERGIAVIMISHHLGAVADYASALCLVAGQSRPIEIGPRDEVITSERLSAAYGCPVTVAAIGSHAAIHLADPSPPDGRR